MINYIKANLSHVKEMQTLVQPYVEDGTFKVEFVMTDKNKADPFTKNVGNEKYLDYSSQYLKNGKEMI